MKNIPLGINTAISESEEKSEFLGLGNKKKRADKKIAKAAKQEAKGNIVAANRKKRAAGKLLSKAQKQDGRKKRRAERKALRKAGKALSAEQLADEQLDIEEAKEDGDLAEAEDLSKESKASESLDYSDTEDGFPLWAKISIGVVGTGLLIVGIGYAVKWANKGAAAPVIKPAI